MRAVTLTNITYTTSGNNFYKITIVNKSFLRANNCTFDTIRGLFLYVSGSTLQVESNSTLS